MNDNGPALLLASTSVLDPDAPFFLRLHVAALRESPIADVLRRGQRFGGLFRRSTSEGFDPVESLDAVASMAPRVRVGPRGLGSDAWTVVALVRRAISPRDLVAFAVMGEGPSGWAARGPYAMAPLRPPWSRYAAFVGASREILVLPHVEEAAALAALVEQLARPESPIDPALVFEPGKLGEIRLATSGLPMGIAAIHLTGSVLSADAGVLVEGEIEALPGRDPAALGAELERLIRDPATSTVLDAMGLAGLPARVSLQLTASQVRVSASLEWAEVGRIVELITSTTTGAPPERSPDPVVAPVPPPPSR